MINLSYLKDLFFRIKSKFSTPVIEFLYLEEEAPSLAMPVPAYKKIPTWFKKAPSIMSKSHRDTFGGASFGAKKCLPLLDALSMGFIIPLSGDVNVRTDKSKRLIEVSTNPQLGELITFHSVDQLGGKTSPTYPGPAIKFKSRFIIKTRPGWSCWIGPCLNSDESRFTCLSGVVDTDRYPTTINFPAIWNTPDYDGVIESGTPLVTVIPFKRKDMPRNFICRPLTSKERTAYKDLQIAQSSRRGVYTQELRDPRDYD